MYLPEYFKEDNHERIAALVQDIGFEIEITNIQAKFKLSQNRSEEDRLRVIEKLASSTNSLEVSVAKLMS